MTIPGAQLPPGLYEAVLARVEAARVRTARIQFALLGALSCVLTVLSVTAYQYAVAEAEASGFGSYLSLLFSDSTLVLTSRDFALSLVESLPSLAVLLLALATGALMWSTYRTVHSARSAFAYV